MVKTQMSMHESVSCISNYSDLITLSKTEEAYSNVPLSTCSNRGDIIEGTTRKFMESYTGQASYAPEITQSISGKKRGRNATEYDFKMDGRRYEVKSAQLQWDKTNKRWNALWQAVKKDSHDILLLVLYSPSGLSIYEHDGVLGVTTHGKAQESSGGCVCVYGKCNGVEIRDAERVIHDKMQYLYLGRLTFDQVSLPDVMSPFQGTPLSKNGSKTRGVIIERIVRRFMESHAGQASYDAEITQSISGKKRGRNATEYDFKMDGRRYEVKSAQLIWKKRDKSWCATWKKVKKDSHDILLLVLHSPSGLSIYKHDGVLGVTTIGKAQESCGGDVCVWGIRNGVVMQDVERVIHDKMAHMFVGKITF